MNCRVLCLLFLIVSPTITASSTLPPPPKKAEGTEENQSSKPTSLVPQTNQLQQRGKPSEAARTSNRLTKSLLAGLRWAFAGAAIGALYEILLGVEDEPSYLPSAYCAAAMGIFGFIRRMRMKTIEDTTSWDIKDDGKAAGVAPEQKEGENEYSRLVARVEQKERKRFRMDVLEFEQAVPPPKNVPYRSPVSFVVFPSLGILDSWPSRVFPWHNLITAITFQHDIFGLSAFVSDRTIQSAFCEVDKSGKMTGRVLGRGTGEGLHWDGDGWSHSVPKSHFYVQLPTINEAEFHSRSIKIVPEKVFQLPEFVKTRDTFSKIVTGATLPGSVRLSSSTFGMYYAEDDKALAFHDTQTDMASLFHVTVVPKSLKIPSMPELLGSGDKLEVCEAFQSMNKLGQCFLLTNKQWFLKHYSILESDSSEAWDAMKKTIQLGFDVGRTTHGYLRMHALMGTLTPEGIHPNFVDSWMSIATANSLMQCPDNLPRYHREEDCLGRGPPLVTQNIPSRLTCGKREAPVQEQDWRYPVTPQPLSMCESPYRVAEDGTVYLDMSLFQPKHRQMIKDLVAGGEGWGYQRNWERIESQSGIFVGPIEQRSKPLQQKVWSN
eukprot:c4980_g1_i1.p1 GENE.c4980_g1_i1~~c4980_g1_i1.p1  ORF type:complete len:604 (-),score=168.33 c4980_g1_i1:69-1880(-)